MTSHEQEYADTIKRMVYLVQKLARHEQEYADTIKRMVYLVQKLARKDAIEAAVKIYRSLHSGGCRVLSEGEGCDCFLCQVQRWVEEHAT